MKRPEGTVVKHWPETDTTPEMTVIKLHNESGKRYHVEIDPERRFYDPMGFGAYVVEEHLRETLAPYLDKPLTEEDLEEMYQEVIRAYRYMKKISEF